MKIFLIILLIIGLLKLVSLFILLIIEIYHRIVKVDINGVTKEYGIYKEDNCYIIPSINVSKSGKYFEIIIVWLCFTYYSAYHIDKDNDEK